MINAVMRKLDKACFGIQFLSIASLFHFPQRSSSSAYFSAFFISPLSVHRTGSLDLRPHPLIVLLAQCPQSCHFWLQTAPANVVLWSQEMREVTLGAFPTSLGCCEVKVEDASKMWAWYLTYESQSHFPFTKIPPAISPATLSQSGLCFPCLKSSPSPIARLHFFLGYPCTSPL